MTTQPNRRTNRKLTKLGSMVPLAAAVLGGLSILTADSWLLLLAGGALGLLVAALVQQPRIAELAFYVFPLGRTTVGETVLWHEHVSNPSERRTSLARVTHERIGLADVTMLIPPLRPGQTACIKTQREVIARTSGALGTVTIASSEPLGLIKRRIGGAWTCDLIAHPRVSPVQVKTRQATDDGTGTAVVSRAGLDVHGVREWQPGDGTGQVHWRSTARRGRLVVLERETRVCVGFALLVVGPPGQPSWEPLVALAASNAVAAARAGRRVSVLAGQPNQPVLTSRDRVGLLDWFAALTDPILPSPALVAQALRTAGSGGELVVAATWVPPGWWATTTAAARTAGVRLEVLT